MDGCSVAQWLDPFHEEGYRSRPVKTRITIDATRRALPSNEVPGPRGAAWGAFTAARPWAGAPAALRARVFSVGLAAGGSAWSSVALDTPLGI